MQQLQDVYIAIMAGGAGTRFWPKSKSAFPKQFLDVLGNGKTLLQQTFARATSLVPADHVLVVTNQQYATIVREQLIDIPHENILCEPLRKNTAPALTFLTYYLQAKSPQATMIAVPSDHAILNDDEFNHTLIKAVNFCKEHNSLVTMGISPTSPHTGYGYIQKGEQFNDVYPDIYKVRTFTEKPRLEIAEQFVATGEFFWNAGIFIWTVNNGLKAIEQYMPQETDAFKRLFSTYLETKDLQEKQLLLKSIFEQCRNISIDYALLEQADNVFVVASYFDWNDLGSWSSVYELKNKDEEQNAIAQAKNTILLNVKNCLVDVSPQKLVLIDDLDDYLIVDTNEALMICKKSNSQKIKNYLDIIKERGQQDYL